MDLRATGAIDACRVKDERTARASVRDAMIMGYRMEIDFCGFEEKWQVQVMTQSSTLTAKFSISNRTSDRKHFRPA